MIRRFLERHIREGTLHLFLPDGREWSFGQGAPVAVWRILRKGTLSRVVADPERQLGETYVDGAWSVDGGRLLDLLEVLFRNFRPAQRAARAVRRPWVRAARSFHQWNPVFRSRRNASHHYDRDEDLFRRFLDADLHYSCAYFERSGLSLEEAQRAKCRHIARKLRLEPGMTVLDIGCGWGGLALHLARVHGVRVTGITLAREQLAVARRRAREEGMDHRVSFRLEDYRRHGGRYDRVVSVGMFEHVGRPHYGAFFHRLEELLAPDGVALVHTIGRTGPGGTTNPWIRRHIFPGGYVPALSELSAAVEPTGLMPTDVEVLRLHYADTLAAWQDRFQRQRAALADRLGERFCRMWEFYLAVSEASFRWDDLVVFQVQLALCHGAVPVVRSYLYEPDRLHTVPDALSA